MNLNANIKPTQHYDYYFYLWSIFYCKHIGQRWRIVFHVISEGQDCCIIPQVVNHKRKKLHGVSYYGRLDYEDIISSTNDLQFNSRCMDAVLSHYRGYGIYINNINEGSLLFNIFKKQLSFEENCVRIELMNDYKQYLEGLSKHQQQNIRTAYNKIAKSAFEIHLQTYDKTHPISRRLWNQCQKLYERRGGDSGGRVQLWWRRQQNAFTHILHHIDSHRIYVLMHGTTPIAYMAGMYDENHKCFYVPRLSHDIDFNRYSPGILLITETIKELITQGVQYLDLMRGDEPYKLAMGGAIHKNYYLDCNVNDLLS